MSMFINVSVNAYGFFLYIITGLNFDETLAIPDKKFRSLMEITKADFQKLLKIICEDDKKSGYRSMNNCLAMLLIKLWTGMSNDVIATLFDIDDSTVGRHISIAREKLMKKFVPKFLDNNLIMK